MSKCIKCGSYAFNLHKEEIDQGGLCDVHYWQGRAHRAEALAEQPAQQEPVAWPHKWGCRANAFGECDMGCTTTQAQQQEPDAIVTSLTADPDGVARSGLDRELPLMAGVYLTPQPAQQEPMDSLGMPLSCGKPLCSPGDHHPLCKLAEQPAQQEPVAWVDLSNEELASTLSRCSNLEKPMLTAMRVVCETLRMRNGYPPPAEQPAQHGHTYASTQATKCAGCGEHKHTPLRIDAMGGYVCLTCIDRKLGSLLGEFGYPEPEQPAQQQEQLREENERLHVENRRLIDRIETIGVPVGVGGFATTTTAQPSKPWVGLTPDDIRGLCANTTPSTWDISLCRLVEKFLKEKNT